MHIKLYLLFEELNKMFKNPNYITQLEGDFRNPTSITTPIVEIQSDVNIVYKYDLIDDENDYIVDGDGNDVDIIEDLSIWDINYIYIEELHRYYFVNNIVLLNNQLFQFQCSIDVLQSYNTEITNLKALVSRNQYQYFKEIEDELMYYNFKENVEEYTITTGKEFSFNPSLNDGNKARYILTCQSDIIPSLKDNIQSPNPCLPSISEISCGANSFFGTFSMTTSNVDLLAIEILNHEEYASFILSLVCYPFEITDTNYDGEIRVHMGKTALNNVKCYVLNQNRSKYFKVASFYVNTYAGFNRGYMEREPYSKYELYLPYYDYVELKSSDIIDSLISVYYSFDYTNGTAKINIINETKNYVIKSVTANVGIKVSIGRTNQQQLADERTQLAIKSAISGFTGLASIGIGAYTGNPFLVASGVTGLASTGVEIGEKLALQHERGSISNNTGTDGLYGCQDVRLKVTSYVKREPTDYAMYYGKPYNQTIKLNQLNGYTIVKDIHLEDINATKSEIETIDAILKSGVIL